MTQHAIICKRTGEAIAVKLDGGKCVCPSADECRLNPTCECDSLGYTDRPCPKCGGDL